MTSSQAMEPIEVPLDELETNRYNPRQNFDEDEIEQLGQRIRDFGLVQRLAVREVEGTYEVVAGERRLRAMRAVNYSDPVPCDLHDLTDDQAREYCLVENLDREDLTPIEEALGYAHNIYVSYNGVRESYAEYINTQNDESVVVQVPGNNNSAISELAEKISPSADLIQKRLVLLTLPSDVQTALSEGDITLHVGVSIAPLRHVDDADKRDREMRRLAERYSGSNPDIDRLRNEVSRIREGHEQAKQDREEALEEATERREETAADLVDTFNQTLTWFNEEALADDADPFNFPQLDFDDPDQIANVVETEVTDRFADRRQELRSTWNNDLLQKQSYINARRDWLEDSLNHMENHGIHDCPTCATDVDGEHINGILDGYNEEYDEVNAEINRVNDLREAVKQRARTLVNKMDDYEAADRDLRDAEERMEEAQ